MSLKFSGLAKIPAIADQESGACFPKQVDLEEE
jgi:hypothetical protein